MRAEAARVRSASKLNQAHEGLGAVLSARLLSKMKLAAPCLELPLSSFNL
jgi:hypothetical protein